MTKRNTKRMDEIYDARSDAALSNLVHVHYHQIKDVVFNMGVGDKKEVYKRMVEASKNKNNQNVGPDPNIILPSFGLTLGQFATWQVLHGK
jgi:hypothetical protein